MGNPVVVLAERNKELRGRLLCQLLCQGFEVIESSSMSEVLRALRCRRDIGLFIMSASLDEPGDGAEFARLIFHSGAALRVILTSTLHQQSWTDTDGEGAPSASAEHPLPYDDILASVYRSC
ncbi:MAG: hypothetical protein AB7P69_01685 [Candidatus Binatia bacterium]